MKDELMKKFHSKRETILKMGGQKKLDAYKAEGKLNARERVDYLVDEDTWQEIGMFAHSKLRDVGEKAPCDGKIAGFGKIDERIVGVASNDLTVKGASSGVINGKKIGYLKRITDERGIPLFFLSEAGGARMPDYMGARNMVAYAQNPTQYQRVRHSPWVSCLLGPCFGSPTWFSSMSDFTVMKKGAVMAVSSGKVMTFATGEETSEEELGGWRVHDEITGLIDKVAESDEECMDIAKKFLSYLPSNATEPPPVVEVPEGSGAEMNKILDYLPESRKRAYDMRNIMKCIVDGSELFELKENFGKSAVTTLARIDGQTVGIIGNNTMFAAGALTAEACEKITSFIVLCDSFNIPIIMLVDTPGFLIGKVGERKKITGKIINFMNALTLATVPKLTILIRKTYGQAYLNMGGGRHSDTIVAWPTAEISFMDAETGVNVVYNLKKEDDPEKFKEKMKIMDLDTEPWGAAGIFNINDIIEPSKTREWLINMLESHYNYRTGGVGKHLMHNWPTSY
ncbi:MAG: carboxyl transferase domain-containing protein [Thermodesulfobacteriota bacterium]